MSDAGTAYLRVKNEDDRPIYQPRPFGPKAVDHPSIGYPCAACGDNFAPGDWTGLVPLGPGSDPEEQEKASTSRYYTAVALEVHWACITGRRVME